MNTVLHYVDATDSRPRALAEAFGIGPGANASTRAAAFARIRSYSAADRRKVAEDISAEVERSAQTDPAPAGGRR